MFSEVERFRREDVGRCVVSRWVDAAETIGRAILSLSNCCLFS